MHLIVLVTCPSDAAEGIAKEVLSERLAACVNILERVRSRYWWRGRLESADESLLLIKTESRLFKKLERTVGRVHPYENPEMVALRIAKGSKRYLDWISEETRPVAEKRKERGSR